MNAKELLEKLQKVGANISIDDTGRLHVKAPKDAITLELKTAITTCRTELLAVAALDACGRAWDAGKVAEAETWAARFGEYASKLWERQNGA